MEPTEDSPQQRDAKAEELVLAAARKALVLERQFRRFKWEIRGYYAIIALFIFSEII